MTPKQRRQLRRRINHVANRLNRAQERLAVLREADELQLRGPLKALVERAAKDGGLSGLKDRDKDGGIDFEELVDAVVEFLDQKAEPNEPILEWMSDVGLELAANIAVAIYNRTEDRLLRRVERDKAQLARLKSRLLA